MMLRGLLLAILLAALPACDNLDEAAPYSNPLDRLAVAARLPLLLYEPCFRKANDDPDVLEFIGERRCYRLDRPEHMRGIWRRHIEHSSFEPIGAAPEATGSDIWLSIDPHLIPNDYGYRGSGPTTFVVEIIGRRASHPGKYGHFRQWRHLVVVDTLLSIRPSLPAPSDYNR